MTFVTIIRERTLALCVTTAFLDFTHPVHIPHFHLQSIPAPFN
jgi:hypothetical protein